MGEKINIWTVYSQDEGEKTVLYIGENGHYFLLSCFICREGALWWKKVFREEKIIPLTKIEEVLKEALDWKGKQNFLNKIMKG